MVNWRAFIYSRHDLVVDDVTDRIITPVNHPDAQWLYTDRVDSCRWPPDATVGAVN